MRLPFAVLVLWVSTAWAVAPSYLSSFDAVDHDDNSGPTFTDVLDLTTIETATDEDVRAIRCSDNSYRCHNDANGGDSSSRWSGKINLASGERGGWEQHPFLPFAAAQGCIGFTLHRGSGLGASGEREIARWTMGSDVQGVNVRLTSSHTLKLYYQSTYYATAETVLNTNACSDNEHRGCSAGGDCASTTCSTCNTASTGDNCFWPYIELCQTNTVQAGGTLIRGTLWVNGALEADTTLVSGGATAANLSGFEVGGPGTEAATLQLSFDDLVVTSDTRTGPSYLHWMTPSTGYQEGANEATCGAGGATLYVRCVNDWGNSGIDYLNFSESGPDNTMRTNVEGRGFTISRFTPALASVPEKAIIPAVAVPTIGRTGTGTDWTTGVRIGQCPTSTSCTSFGDLETIKHDAQTNAILTGYPIRDTPPAGGGNWNVANLVQLGASWSAVETSSSNILRANAMGAVAWVRRPDQEPIANLEDHNLGTEDGATTVMIHADSTGVGVGGTLCLGGDNADSACSQATYCSWDATNKGKPVGGCVSDAQCQSCEDRRTEFDNGAGIACVADAGCDFGTCSVADTCGLGTGTCSVDADIVCSCDADCDLGTCATTATCEESCPGGSCPGRGGFPNFMNFVSDNFYNCGQDALSTPVATGLFSKSLYGRASNCRKVWGADGKCTCSSNAECQASSGGTCDKSGGNGRCSTSIHTTCTVDGNCPGGETCLGLCTASDNGRNACTGPTVLGAVPTTNQCATSRVCAFPFPDYVLNAVWFNDLVNGAWQQGDCKWPYLVNTDCDNCTETACVADSTCTSAISASSRCLGVDGNSTSNGCFGEHFDYPSRPTCSTYSGACLSDAQCPLGQTCDGETGTTERDGTCVCASDANCPADYDCQGGICRRLCSAGCGTGGTCDTSTTPDVCAGRCTCPCDAVSCSVDSDCPAKANYNFGGVYPSRDLHGKCVAGKCSQCVGSNCASVNSFSYQHNFARHTSGAYWGRKNREWIGLITTEAARTSESTVPRLIPVIQPKGRSEYRPTCQGTYWGDAENAQAQTRAQYTSEFPLVADASRYLLEHASEGIFADDVHPTPEGCDPWGRSIGDYLETINACRTGTGPASVLARYCRNLDGTWDTDGSGYTLCTVNGDCDSGGDLNDSCVKRVCTVDDDTSSGCPGAPTCHLE